MSYLRTISWIKDREYEVVFVVEQRHLTMTCTVAEDKGIQYVVPEPDLMFASGISPRLIAAAVIAFDEVVMACLADLGTPGATPAPKLR